MPSGVVENLQHVVASLPGGWTVWVICVCQKHFVLELAMQSLRGGSSTGQGDGGLMMPEVLLVLPILLSYGQYHYLK